MYGIENYYPKEYIYITDLVSDYEKMFKNLIGKKINCMLMACEDYSKEIYKDAPIILSVGDNLLEVSCFQDHKILFSMGTIDIHSPFQWHDASTINMIWTKMDNQSLQNILKGSIIDILLIEELINYENMRRKVFSGICFKTTTGELYIRNALDEIDFEFDIKKGYRFYSVMKSKYKKI